VRLPVFVTVVGLEVSTSEFMDTSLRGKRRHKSWPDALKREIVSASLAPGASVSIVARQYDVNANQVFVWRKRYCAAPAAAPGPQLIPVVLTPDRADTPPPPAADIIEIELSSGHRLRVAGGVKAASLRLVLDALERR
jgi:transposase